MFSIFAILLSGCLLAIFNNTFIYEIIVYFSILSVSTCYLIDISKSKRFKLYIKPLFFAVLFRLVILYVFRYIYLNNIMSIPVISQELFSDPLSFYTNAVGYVNGNSNFTGGFFVTFLGSIYKVVGCSRLLGEFLVSFFSVLSINITILINEELEINYSSSKKCIWLLSVLPYTLLYSTMLRRESIIILCVSISLLFYIKWVDNKGIINFVKCLLFSVFASLFHGGTGIIAVGYIMTMILYNPSSQKIKLKITNIFGSLLFFGVFLFLFNNYKDVLFTKLDNISDISTIAKTSSLGGSSYAQYVGDSRTPLRFTVFLVPRYIYFMFSPFPWQWRGMGDIISFISSSVLYLTIIILSVKYIFRNKLEGGNRTLLILLSLIALVTAITFSWGVSNTGTAIRHRDKFIVLYITMLAIIDNYKIKAKNKYEKEVN